MKRSIQTISFVLIFALLVQFVPVGVFATDDKHITSTEPDLTTPTQVNSNDAFDGIIAEDKTKREEAVKHFLCADGTYKAVSYGTRVHWKPTENSNWIPIDNRLTLQSSDGEFFYTPFSSPVDVRLAYKSGNNHLASYKIGENTISWYYEDGAADITPTVESGLSAASATADKSSPAILQNLTGVITYENLFDNTDVQYTVTPEGIKEDIILKNASAATSYQVTYDISGMTATQSGNTIVLAKNGKDIATLGAPIAEDAAGVISKNADLELMSTRSGKMTIQVSADTSWLAEKTRTYPIKIDPYVFEVIEDASDDASALYSWSSYPYGTLVVGKTHSYGKARAFLRFALPELSSGDMVIGGQLVLSQYQTSTGYYASNGKSMTIQVKRVTEDWPGATIRNSKSFSGLPAVSNEIEEYIETKEVSSKTYRDFDLSELTKGWYNGSYDNYGICLSSTEEDRMVQTSFVSRNNSSYPEHWPNLVVSYLNNKGLESRWTYHNQSAGSSGEGYVNDYTGNLVFIAPIMADSGNMVPMSVHVVYNGYQAGAYSGAMKAGLGWRLDYAQSIEALSSSSADALVKSLYAAGFRYKYTDTDGTEHYFKSSGTSGKYVDEEGLDLTLTVYSSTNSASEKYMLEMANGEKISFTSSGKVRRLYDSDGNYLQYYYVGSSYVDEVHDGSAGYHSSTTRTGRRTALYYDSSTRLTSVTDSSGRTTSLTYDSTGLLTRITYPDDTYTSFSYTNNKLSKVVARDGYTLVYEYPTTGDAAEKSRVIKVTEYNNTGTVSDSTKGNSLSMTYTGYNYTEFTDNRGRSETYQFDNIGRTTCIIDATGGATKYDYTDSDTKTAQANKLTGMSAVAHHVNNLLTDTSFEASTSAWTAGSGASVVSENPRLGSKSMKLTGEASASRTVTLSAGDYTFSAYVKTGADGVNPQLEVKNGGTTLAASSALTTEGDYTRLSVSFTAPQGSTELILKTTGSGSAWFDTAQLETGLTVNEYNLLENSSFEDTSSTVWTGSGLSTSTDGYKTGGVSGNAYGLTGSITASKRIYQSVPINKPAGSIAFSLTGMAKAASVPLTKDSGRIFALVAKTTFTDGSYSEKKFTLNPDVKLWQYTTGVVAYTSAEASKTVQK
ncbi:MAG: DNRLRE domain-containing protein, partial [Clostridia bacterium]|nr:DNRLRE domain-containing protein [Clostridia bacterium]